MCMSLVSRLFGRSQRGCPFMIRMQDAPLEKGEKLAGMP